jgi:hypothetical protein
MTPVLNEKKSNKTTSSDISCKPAFVKEWSTFKLDGFEWLAVQNFDFKVLVPIQKKRKISAEHTTLQPVIIENLFNCSVPTL